MQQMGEGGGWTMRQRGEVCRQSPRLSPSSLRVPPSPAAIAARDGFKNTLEFISTVTEADPVKGRMLQVRTQRPWDGTTCWLASSQGGASLAVSAWLWKQLPLLLTLIWPLSGMHRIISY